jgi:serine/threonine protein kinase
VSVVLQEGTMLNGRYRVQRVLGTGAFGRVYLAEDTEDPNSPPLAIKELLAMEFATAEEQRDAISWFKREVSTLLTLEHPGIPSIHGYWTAHRTSGPMYLAMDFIPGMTLAEIHAQHGGQVPWRQVATWGAALCGVLAYLHGRTPPFVFRDLKPANVLIDSRSNQPVLIDFGLARQLIPIGGTAVGTWGYVPFEQVLGKAEPRSDLYALGAMLHALITGRQPDAEYRRLLRTGLDLEGALRALFPPIATIVPSVPAALSQAIATATAFDVDDRFSSAQAMSAVLQAILDAPGGIVVSGPVAADAASPVPLDSPQPVKAAPPAVPTVQLARSQPGTSPEPPAVMPSTGLVLPPSMAAAVPNPPGHSAAASPSPVPSGPSVQLPAAGPAPQDTTPAVPPTPLLPLELDRLPTLERLPDEDSTPLSRPAIRVSPTEPSELPRSVSKEDPARPRWWQKMNGVAGTGTGSLADHLVVSARGNGHCRTISEAISRAKPGARIEVEPGLYVEGFLIDRPLEIVGLGAAEEIIVEAAKSACALVHTDQAVLRGISLHCVAGLGAERFYAVTVPTGRLLLEDCQIMSNSLACIAIHGEGTQPIVRRCVLRNPNERAVAVYNHARGLLEDCDISGSTVPVRISSHANPTFHRCLIHRGRFGGVYVGEHGRGRFEDCDIVDNGHHGVAVRQGSTPIISRCRINRNGWSAISITDSSGAIVQHCDLRHNRRGPWEVTDAAKLRLDRKDNTEF